MKGDSIFPFVDLPREEDPVTYLAGDSPASKSFFCGLQLRLRCLKIWTQLLCLLCTQGVAPKGMRVQLEVSLPVSLGANTCNQCMLLYTLSDGNLCSDWTLVRHDYVSVRTGATFCGLATI